MITKYYIDSEGKYVGGYSEGNPSLPEGLIEVPYAPENSAQVWNFNTNTYNPYEA